MQPNARGVDPSQPHPDVAQLAALARVACGLDLGKAWASVLPETRAYYFARQASLTPPGLVSVPNGYGIGACAQWQREVRAGVDGQTRHETSWRTGPLFWSACWETLAYQASLDGNASVERTCLLRAAAVIQDATRSREAA